MYNYNTLNITGASKNMSALDFSKPSELCILMGKYGSDKGATNISMSWHNYTIIYNNLFKDIKDEKLRIFELGLGTNHLDIPSNMGVNGKPGASLYAWRDYFKNSVIFGADIDKRILFQDERIQTFYCDQTQKVSINELWDNTNLEENFDIIIDDGLHMPIGNVTFFNNAIHKLKPHGYFIIEDIHVGLTDFYNEKITEWKSNHSNHSFNLVRIPSSVNNADNGLIIIKRNQ